MGSQMALLLLFSALLAAPRTAASTRAAWVEPGASLQAAIDEHAGSTVHVAPGRHALTAPLRLDQRHSGTRIIGHGGPVLSGGEVIPGPWTPVAGRDWLYRALLPPRLRSGLISQLWVGGQRRGAARSPTMRFAGIVADGLRTGPRQLLRSYSNVTAMRCLIYQHWTASYSRVTATDAVSGNITLDRPVDGLSGDLASGSRYFLENAPEYLAPHSGTFYADGATILYAPLESEASRFGAAALLEVVAAVPGMLELVRSANASDVHMQDLAFAHTDADFATCFAGNCALQSATWETTATIHFEFSQRISLHNVSIEHVGGYGLWFGPGVHDAEFLRGRVLDMGAGGVRIGEASSFENGTAARTARNVTVADSVLRDGGNVFRAGMGVLLQAAADSTVTHNEIAVFRQTGISAGWRWNYGPTSDGNNVSRATFPSSVLTAADLANPCHF